MEKLTSTISAELAVEAANSIISTTQEYPNDEKTKGLSGSITAMRDKLVEVSFINYKPFNLNELSTKASRLFKMLDFIVKAYLLSPDENTRSQAGDISKVVLQHKGFLNLGFLNKSAEISMMMQDLNDEQVKTSVNAIPGLEAVVETLEATGREMEAHYHNVLTDRTMQKPEKTMNELKKQLIKMINDDLLPALSAAAYYDPDKFKAQLTTVEDTIRHFNEIHKNRKSKKN